MHDAERTAPAPTTARLVRPVRTAPRLAILVGVGLGLLITLAVLALLPKVPVPKPTSTPDALGGSLLAEDEGSITELLFQYVPELEPIVAEPYADFLPALDPTTRLVAI